MDWLAGWLKTVIMVIMLATFVDLLLPSSAMQRYVKTVMSLFILLTLLSPVLQLFQKNWDVEQLLSAAERKQNDTTLLAGANAGSSGMQSLEAITQTARKLQAEGQKQSQQMLQTQIAGLMKEDLQKQTDLTVKDVQVVAQIDNNGKPAIARVRVTLDDIEPGSQAQPSPGSNSIAVMEPVKPIDPIRIDASAANAKDEKAAAAPEVTARSRQEIDRLKQGITRNWLVEPAHIDIQVEQGNGRIAR
ncbi:stage III sporulation protein AF [Paenibacillus sp. GCM10023248]|uniref:stage III sporulation protein AF n=1 Tax=Bacillales TaxID=1385 RepID=UPI0023783720|nr:MULTISPECIES: stage III sporulation protein AF [Bacillales]MDD9267514.1 stage III sporulation protein AF [Paenibacillus sp. MAHUQ-63]MDR6882732.1 stage III sporulation protein AF [Bacillus sp. 3255]